MPTDMPTDDSMPGAPLLRICGLTKVYGRQVYGQRPALSDVNLQLGRGQTLGLVGPSGSGKSTLARCLTFFEEPTSGEVWFEGRNLWSLDGADRRRMRAEIQIIFQEPAASLNPRFTAAEIVAEPLLIQKRGDRGARMERAVSLMETVGLPRHAAGKRAHEFSGGERQRLAIARALVLDPKLLILDESFSGLDQALEAQICGLLKDLRQRLGLAMIVITHDLSLAAELAGEIAVMESGRIVEHALTARLFAHPRHDSTRALLAATLALGWKQS
jgi:ABC-type glutathione transport system ATPase component